MLHESLRRSVNSATCQLEIVSTCQPDHTHINYAMLCFTSHCSASQATHGSTMAYLMQCSGVMLLKYRLSHDPRPWCCCQNNVSVVMQAQELNPGDVVATKSIARLQPIVAERQEKMKDEMLGEVHYGYFLAAQSDCRMHSGLYMHSMFEVKAAAAVVRCPGLCVVTAPCCHAFPSKV